MLPHMLGDRRLEVLREAGGRLNGDAPAFGVRNPLTKSPRIAEFVHSPPLVRTASALLGAPAVCVRALWFDKPPSANWFVPWHQDRTVAVRSRTTVQGFSGWTRKEGVWHVLAPPEVLERMITLRIHLDDADAENGALQVVPGTHKYGHFAVDGEAGRRVTPAVTLSVRAGDIVAMKPLLLHSSNRSGDHRPRRVLHLEFASDPLPDGLQWHNPLEDPVH